MDSSFAMYLNSKTIPHMVTYNNKYVIHSSFVAFLLYHMYTDSILFGYVTHIAKHIIM